MKPKLPKDYATVHFLKWWYCHLNRELVRKGVFNRLLPIPSVFGFNAPHGSPSGKPPNNLAVTDFDATGKVTRLALVNTIQWSKSWCISALAHELVHIYLGVEIGCKTRDLGYGKFCKKIREVYGSGVLDGWL